MAIILGYPERRGIVSLARVRDVLKYDAANTSDDDELQALIADATRAFEGRQGIAQSLLATVYPDWIFQAAAGQFFHLPYRPVSNLTKLEVHGGAVGSWTEVASSDYELLDYDDHYAIYCPAFIAGQLYRATFTVGHDEAPADAEQAVLYRVLHGFLDVLSKEKRLGILSKNTGSEAGAQAITTQYTYSRASQLWESAVKAHRRLP
jgi:hypothetical protein